MSLRPFTEDAECAKCGGTDIHAAYEKRGHYGCATLKMSWDGEHIDRHCRRCGYGWAESVRLALRRGSTRRKK